MRLTRMLWRVIPKIERNIILSRLNAVERTFYKDFLSGKEFPHYFHETQSIFVHVPKCAGTSVGGALYPGCAIGHKSASWYQTCFPAEYENYFKFAFSRNPWDRVVSAWNFLRNAEKSKHDAHWSKMLNDYHDFNDFVLDWIYPENVVRQIHFAPQHLYICDNTGAISLDYVARFEDIVNDFTKIAQRLSINAQLETLNRSRSDDYRSYYSNASVERIARVYERDIRLFGYNFE